jgi:type II secretory pathway pseudopilin PulG
MRLHVFGTQVISAGGIQGPSSSEETILLKSATRSGTPRSAIAGFSIVELVVSLSVMLILTAIAIPSLMRSFRTYQLNDAATRLAAMLKFTRFEAVRRNTQINFLMLANASGTGYFVGTDSNKNGNLDPTDKQELIAGFATLLASGVGPPPTAISTALGGATLTTKSGSNGSITFDARGAIRVGGNVSASIFVFYIGSSIDPEFGFRAVILLPSGSTQIWTAPGGGPWQQVG